MYANIICIDHLCQQADQWSTATTRDPASSGHLHYDRMPSSLRPKLKCVSLIT